VSTDTNNAVLSSLLRIISGVFTLFVVWHLFKFLGKTSRLPDYEAQNEGDNSRRKAVKCKVLK
jgi:hypothetical protein